eukprot:3634966-Amphidinium_carterae.3
MCAEFCDESWRSALGKLRPSSAPEGDLRCLIMQRSQHRLWEGLPRDCGLLALSSRMVAGNV